MPPVVADLLPRDAELARRAAGGDGAAFVRLYDHYAHDVFATALSVTGSVEAAAEATQAAFLRILRWPPALGAPDGDVLELLYALALGGPHERLDASAAAAVLLIFLAGLAGTLLISGGDSDPIDATPASATGEPRVEKREQPVRSGGAE